MAEEVKTTAIINVLPEADLVVLRLLAEANQLRDYAEKRVIATDADLKPATEDLSLIAKVKKALMEKKAEYVKPVKAYIDAFNTTFLMIMTPVDEADKITRGKILAYRQEQERKAREAEEINRLRMEAARREMELKGELTESVNLVPEGPKPVTKVYTEVGSLGTMKVHKWEVVDFAAVPDQYKTIDAGKVTAVVKASKGIIVLPGIRVWSEDVLKMNVR